MFKMQYTEQWNALDIIAERIRALGHPAHGTFKSFLKLIDLLEDNDDVQNVWHNAEYDEPDE